jgi:hypothetical protein
MKSKSATMSKAWNTKYGPRKVREEPPSLEEAIFAARGLTDDVDAQAEVAASLMGVPVDQVRVALAKASRRTDSATVAFSSTRGGGERAVIVERKPSRRVGSARPLR